MNDEDLNPEMSLEILKKQNLYFSAAHSLSESGFGFTSRFNRKYFRTVDDPSKNLLNMDHSTCTTWVILQKCWNSINKNTNIFLATILIFFS